jgi:hypothetical protein
MKILIAIPVTQGNCRASANEPIRRMEHLKTVFDLEAWAIETNDLDGAQGGDADVGGALHTQGFVTAFAVELVLNLYRCCRLLMPGRRVASFLRVRWRPFCCGWPGLMRSI